MKVHELKCWPEQFRHVKDGRKTFEVRKNDRNFEEGDIVILHEFVPEQMVGQRINASEYGFKYDKAGPTSCNPLGPFRIGYVTTCGALPDGWCGFSLVRLVPETP